VSAINNTNDARYLVQSILFLFSYRKRAMLQSDVPDFRICVPVVHNFEKGFKIFVFLVLKCSELLTKFMRLKLWEE
jgi:hypothetical protein